MLVVLRLLTKARSTAELYYQEFNRRVIIDKSNASEDADNAMTMQNVCKDNVKHHPDSLRHDKRQSVIERGCKVLRNCRDRTSH